MTRAEKNKAIVSKMFNQQKYSPYYISMITDVGIKEIYNYLREDEEAKNRHKTQIRANKEAKILA